MADPLIRTEPGGAARILLARPPLNVLTTGMLQELRGAVEAAAAAPETKVLVLTGAGRAFCAGVEVADHVAGRVEGMIEAFTGAVRALLSVDLPVVCALNGAALGGGLELALASDIVLARAGARLGQPEIRLGVFPPAAAALLPRRVGVQRAMDLVLSGRTIAAEEAQAMGLVAVVAEGDAFDDLVAGYAADLAGLSRPVLRLAKRAIREGLDRPVGEALEVADGLYLGELMALRDAHEGLAAFMEKRPPVWSEG